MTLRKTQRNLSRQLHRISVRFQKEDSGAVAIEFAICMIVFIPIFLGALDYTKIISIKKTTDEIGSSALRAVSHVPEYDVRMRASLQTLCSIHTNATDQIYIEIMSATLDLNSYVIDWTHLPCGSPSGHIPVTEANLNSEFSALNLRQGESIIVVKTAYVAKSLANAKYIFGPENDTFIFFNAAPPRIANSVLYTNDDLYDITTYEY